METRLDAFEDERLLAEAKRVEAALRARGWLLATAESCTGGWVGKVLTDIPGSSDWFGFGLITYSNEAKQRLLAVPEALLMREGAVSEPVALAMAEGARRLADAEVAVAITGVAGPGGGSAAKPVGTVCFAWSVLGTCDAQTQRFQGNREAVRRHSVFHALTGVLHRCQASR